MAFGAGQRPTAAQLNDAMGVIQSDTQITNGTTTSTSYTATLTGGIACGIAFVAPASGKVEIKNESEINNTGGYSLCTIRVRTGAVIGSGADVVAVTDDNALFHNTNIRLSVFNTITGLTPGASYNVQQLFKVTAGTGTFGKKQLSVKATL